MFNRNSFLQKLVAMQIILKSWMWMSFIPQMCVNGKNIPSSDSLADKFTNVKTKSTTLISNKIAGTWLLQSANQTSGNSTSYPYGKDPQGWLIFTPAPDYTFMEEINARNLPLFPNGNITAGTCAQDAEIVAMTQSNAGVYWVDESGDFAGQITVASTVPNYVNVTTSLEKLNLTVVGDDMIENFEPVEGFFLKVLWKRFKGRESLGC